MTMAREPEDLYPDPKRSVWKKLFAAGAFAAAAAVLYSLFADRLSLDYLAQRESLLRQLQIDRPWLVYAATFLIYVVVTGLSLPGATPMSLIVGWYLGLVRGVILVSFASTLGATIAFLLSRFVLRESIQTRFGQRLRIFNEALDRDGPLYLFSLRLIPAVPFFVINVVMGLTRIRTWTFWWVSQIGMLAGTIVYIYAGSSIPSLAQLADPSQLRTHDVADWPELITRIGTAGQQPASAESIYQQLNEPSQDIVDILQSTGAMPNEVEKATLLRSLNVALARPDFAIQPDWLTPKQVTGDDDEAAPSLRKQRTRINRKTLVAAMPGIISATQPILNRQIILAFVLLGTFPIIVKQLMSRFGKRTPESATSVHADQKRPQAPITPT